ncbi:MAG: hypothetical protein U0414_21995 [Polyangiaceae bacterium]
MKSEEAIEELRAIGWFDGLPPATTSTTLAAVQRKDQFDFESLTSVRVDVDGCSSPEDYEAAIQQIAKQTADAFSLRAREIRYSDDRITAEFDVDGHGVECAFPQEDDWMSFEVIDAINSELERQGRRFGLHALPVADSVAHFAITSEQAFRAAVERGLVPGGLDE